MKETNISLDNLSIRSQEHTQKSIFQSGFLTRNNFKKNKTSTINPNSTTYAFPRLRIQTNSYMNQKKLNESETT